MKLSREDKLFIQLLVGYTYCMLVIFFLNYILHRYCESPRESEEPRVIQEEKISEEKLNPEIYKRDEEDEL